MILISDFNFLQFIHESDSLSMKIGSFNIVDECKFKVSQFVKSEYAKFVVVI